MLQIILAIVVPAWFFVAARRVNLHQGKWAFFGFVSFVVPSILWSAVFALFLRKPVFEFFWQHGGENVMLIAGLVTASIGSVLGLASSYVLHRKYLNQGARKAAVALEQSFLTKVIYLLAMLVTSALILYLAAKNAPVIELESKFDYTLF
ncbi:MAG: hypothetical protein WBM80_09175 [Woeseiaceae bacterium]